MCIRDEMKDDHKDDDVGDTRIMRATTTPIHNINALVLSGERRPTMLSHLVALVRSIAHPVQFDGASTWVWNCILWRTTYMGCSPT